MRTFSAIAFCFALGLAAGCGGEPQTTAPAEPEPDYAQSVKQSVHALKGALAAEGVLGVHVEGMMVMDLLADYETESQGEHLETYQALHDGMQDLLTITGSDPAEDDVRSRLDDLIALADNLPGTLSPRTPAAPEPGR